MPRGPPTFEHTLLADTEQMWPHWTGPVISGGRSYNHHFLAMMVRLREHEVRKAKLELGFSWTSKHGFLRTAMICPTTEGGSWTVLHCSSSWVSPKLQPRILRTVFIGFSCKWLNLCALVGGSLASMVVNRRKGQRKVGPWSRKALDLMKTMEWTELDSIFEGWISESFSPTFVTGPTWKHSDLQNIYWAPAGHSRLL